ncbi:hypothetical protein [Methanobacterium petrolearium]|uniref:hypothetical protein n=2 Tax=Methanobacterium petrolearium TaxID=710190 RepID=UPI0030817C34|nr:hypothetical protein [Methanobacterium petrolearium]
MDKNNSILKVVTILLGIGIIIGFLIIFLNSRSPLDMLFISMGLMVVIIGFHTQGVEINKTITYFVAMGTVNVVQWLIVAYTLCFMGQIRLYGDFLIILMIAPLMSISLANQIHKKSLKSHENENITSDKMKGRLDDKVRVVLTSIGFVIMLVCLWSFIFSKSPLELYGSFIGIMAIIWGFYRDKNNKTSSDYTPGMSHLKMYRESKNIKVTVNYSLAMGIVLIFQLLIICYIIIYYQSEIQGIPFVLFITFWATFYFYVQIRESDLKYIGKRRKKRKVNNGYLVCDKCNGYYKLQPDESPDDFTDECECGGKLKYWDSI